MSSRRSAALIPAAASAVGVLMAVDVVRQVQLGTADASLWFNSAATCVALASAVLVGRWPERRRMALLILFWLLSGVVIDAGSDWPASRIAVTAWLLALALQAPAYSQMALAYPSGHVRDRIERAFLYSRMSSACCGSWRPRCSPTLAAPAARRTSPRSSSPATSST